MSKQMKIFNKACAFVFLSSFWLVSAAEAKIVSQSKEIVVEQPGDLPELSQRKGLALQLYSGSGDGNTYLYIEQHQGERLLVLDVTDPAYTKMVGAVTLTVPGPFDFVGPIGNSAMLLQYRNNRGIAILKSKECQVSHPQDN